MPLPDAQAEKYISDFVQIIRNNLENYKLDNSGLTLLKEFLQNADDAEDGNVHAENVHFGWIPARSGDTSFWGGPSFFVLNDGPFTEKHRKGIKSFASPEKAKEKSKIGKFGLGLKSLHHWSELFCYFVHPESDFLGIVNPWRETEDPRDDWMRIPEEINLKIEKIVDQVYRESSSKKKMFCIWMPLRSRKRMNGKEAIKDNFEGDEGISRTILESEATPFHLAAMLPMLRHLKRIHGWMGGGDSGTDLHRQFEVSITSNSLFPVFSLAKPAPRNEESMSIVSGKAQRNPPFGGFVIHPDDRVLSEYQRGETWPKNEPNLVQHAATYFVEGPVSENGKPQFSVSMAVFLPLGKPITLAMESSPKCSIPSVSLFLHGDFFIDSGRKAILGVDRSDISHYTGEDKIRMQWNHRLLEVGTLPLFLHALRRFVDKATWSVEQIDLFVRTIQKHRENFRENIWKGIDDEKLFGNFSWLCRYDCGMNRWELVNNDFYEIPHPKKLSLVEIVFPNFAETVGSLVVTFNDSNRLTTKRAMPFSPSILSRLLHDVDPKTLFADPDNVEYLLRFLENSAMDFPVASLVDLWNRIMHDILLEDLDDTSLEYLKRIVQRIPENKRFQFPGEKKETASPLIRSLTLLKGLEIAVVPECILRDETGGTTISVTTAIRLLKGLDAWKHQHKRTEEEYNDIAMAAARIRRATDDSRQIGKECDSLSLFRARSCVRKKEDDFSYEELRRSYDSRNLFTKIVNVAATIEFANRLQNSLTPEHNEIIVISDSVYQILFSTEKRPCNPPNIVQYFQEKRPKLADVENRQELFASLLKENIGSRKQVLRYLIHGFEDRYDSEESLFLPPEGLYGVWSRLATQIWDTDDNRWQVLEPLVVQTFCDLRKEEKQALNIVPLTVREIAEKLNDMPRGNLMKFSELCPNAEEYKELLRVFRDYPHELCHAMPIHRTVDDHYVSIVRGTTFLAPEKEIAPELFESIIVIKRFCTEQRDFINELDGTHIVELVLEYSRPEKHWNLILDAARDDVQSLRSNVERLKSVKWLPDANGNGVAMRDFIRLPRLDDDIHRELLQLPEQFHCLNDLWIDETTQRGVCHHEGFECLVEFFPNEIESVRNLALFLLVRDERNQIGYDPGEKRETWMELFRDAVDVFPCMPLLSRVQKEYPNELSMLMTELAASGSLRGKRSRVTKILEHLRKSNELTDERLDVYLRYLMFILTADNFIELMKTGDILLPNMLDQWCLPADLCDSGCEGITERSRLDPRVSKSLGKMIPPTHFSPTENDETAGKLALGRYEDLENDKYARALREYFKPWSDFVFPEIIGAFLSLCGGNIHVEKLAQDYLDKIPLEEIRARLLDDPARINTIRNKRVAFSISKGPKANVPNLFDEIKEFQKQKKPINVFVGNIARESKEIGIWQGVVAFQLHDFLQEVFVSENTDWLSKIVVESAHALCSTVFGYDDRYFRERLTEFWNELNNSDENDIEVFQRLFLKDCHLLLEEHYSLLSIDMQRSLRSILDCMDRKECSRDAKVRKELDAEIDRSRREIRQMLEQDEEKNRVAQSSILHSTRKIIDKDCQYSISSIPFELFQNADDAWLQLDEFGPCDGICSFELRKDADRLIAVHSGRKVNDYPKDRREDDESYLDLRFRFGRDLHGMLGLHKSKKHATETEECLNVTGKFGLGFKSVFLLSDEPRVYSGRRRFRIIGGVYPVFLKKSDYEHFLESLESPLAPPFQKDASTVFVLPFREKTPGVADVLKRFETLVHPLLVFAKKIRRCTIDEKPISWSERTLNGFENVGYGSFIPYSNSPIQSPIGLVFRSKYGAILFELDVNGFQPMPEEVPTFWVMAPTEETAEVGFLVNSSEFQIDVGRSRFTGKENNAEIAEHLSRAFGHQLIRFFERTENDADWDLMKDELGLLPNLERYDFWESLWTLLAKNLSGNKKDRSRIPAADLLHKIFWDTDDSGARSLYSKCRTIPSGLRPDIRTTGNFRKLVSLSEVRFALRAELETNQVVFKHVSSWESFQDKVQPGSIVSGSVCDVLTTLNLFDQPLQIRKVDLETVLRWECADSKIDPERAKRLGHFFMEIFPLDGITDLEQRKRIQELLRSLKFQTRKGGKYSGDSNLLAPYPDDLVDHREENDRTKFAPDENLLHAGYQGSALDFFRLCREKMEAKAQTMAGWGRDLNETQPEKRLAFLQYLIKGELGASVGKYLTETGIGWLNRLPQSDLWNRLSDGGGSIRNDQAILAGRLGKTTDWFPPSADFSQGTLFIQLDPGPTLQHISHWWKKKSNRDIWLAKYHERVYPRDFEMKELLHADDNRAWVILFLLGVSHTMGRTQLGQHRGFLDMCDKRGWLDVFAAPDYDSGKWMSVIEEYIDDSDQQEYMQWMKNFVSIYAVSRFVDEHREKFMAIDKIDKSFPAVSITRSRESLLFQRGGNTTVPISKSLGIGFCFIVRELVRLEKLSNRFVHEHCFVPTKGIRDLFRGMGCDHIGDTTDCQDSKKIYEFLKKHLSETDATFDRCFDIPFHIILSDDGLKNQFGLSNIR